MLSEFNSQEAVGSAMQEAEKSANNWAGSINKLKNSWAELINQFINSDNAITIIQTLNNIIQDLTDSVATGTIKVLASLLTDIVKTLGVITDKVGALPALISAIYTTRYIKSGKGIFGQVTDDTNKFSTSLTILDKNVKDVVKDFKNASFGNKLSAAFGKSGITSEDVAMLRQYNAEIAKGVPEHEAFNKTLSGASNQAKQLAIDAEGAAVSEKVLTGATQSYTAAQKAATLATKAFAVALNMAFSLAITYTISKIVEGISAVAHSTERTIERQKEYNRLREESTRNANANLKEYESEQAELNSLVDQYYNALSATEDINDAKSTLLKIQEVLNKEYDTEGDSLDDLSGKYKALNGDIREYNRLNAESKLETNKTEIDRARNELSNVVWYSRASENGKVGYGGVNFFAEDLSEEVWEQFKTRIGQLSLANPIDIDDDAFRINLSGTFEDAISDYTQILKVYREVASPKDVRETEAYLSDLISHYKEISEIDANATHLESLIYPDDAKSQEAIDTFDELTDKAKEYIKVVNSSSSDSATKISAYNEVVKIKDEIDGLVKDYPFLNEEAKKFKDQIAINFDEASGSIEVAKENWLKSLDEAQKGILSNVDKITSAMAKLASGEAIDSKAAWDIINLDDNKLLSNISIDANGDYIFDLEQIVKLKDDILQKEIEAREESIKTAKQNAKTAEENIKVAESQIYALRPKMAAAYDSGDKELIAELEAEYESLKRAVESNRSSLEAYNYTIRNESLYVTELKMRLGDLADTVDMLKAKIERMKKEVENLNKEADGLLKAQEHVIDGIIDKYEDGLDILENQKGALEEQLAVLENQEDELNDIIDKYKTVSGYVQDTISKQIEGIEDNRKEIEDYYDNLIDKLKSENEEREDAIEYEKKLAALNNAKNNKVRAYDQARGWVYEANKDAIKDAQNDLDSFQNEQAIKSLEKEKEDAVKGFDERIKQLEEYSDEWKDVINSTTEAENELLATEILGSDWREKIARRDEATLTKFKTAFGKYNADLESLTKNEIANLKKSISAVDNEVVAKRKQIEVWKNYKTEITNAASDIKNGLEEYIEYLGTVTVNENSTNAQRLNNLSNFEARYKAIVSEITTKNQQIADSTERYNELADAMRKVQDVTGGGENLGASIGGSLASAIGVFASKLETFSKTFEKLFEPIANRLNKLGEADRAMDEILGFSGGGTADYTGLAMVHGSRTRAETVFNASQSKKLLNLVEAMPNFSGYLKTPASVMAKKNETNNITGTTFSIANMTVVANNPEQFEAQMKRYWQTKLTESKVY